MIDDVSLVFCVTADVSVRERMVRRLNGLGTLVICTDLAELQAMIGPPASSRPARLSTSAAVPTPAAAAPAVTAGRTSLGDLTIDPLGHLVTWRGQPLALTRLERRLLTQLATGTARSLDVREALRVGLGLRVPRRHVDPALGRQAVTPQTARRRRHPARAHRSRDRLPAQRRMSPGDKQNGSSPGFR